MTDNTNTENGNKTTKKPATSPTAIREREGKDSKWTEIGVAFAAQGRQGLRHPLRRGAAQRPHHPPRAEREEVTNSNRAGFGPPTTERNHAMTTLNHYATDSLSGLSAIAPALRRYGHRPGLRRRPRGAGTPVRRTPPDLRPQLTGKESRP